MQVVSQVLRRIAAFADSPDGGNPAGVWVDDALPDSEAMQSIAADVGYSETAFIAPSTGTHRTVRYFSPEAEVPFCGHATIAAGYVLGSDSGMGTYVFSTRAGDVPVSVSRNDERIDVSLTSVSTRHRDVPAPLFEEVLSLLGWQQDELDESIPPALAFAGAWHLVLAAKTAGRLANLEYDFDKLKYLMLGNELTTLQLVYRESDKIFHARNPFPVGGVVEDPATGAAAAALGGYLRDASLISAPATFLVRQGEAMGRPSRILVTVPAQGGIHVSGTAVDI